MIHKLITVVFCLLFVSMSFAQTDEVNIIPKPQSVTRGSGTFTFSTKTKVLAISEPGKRMAGILNDLLQRNYGFKLQTTDKPQAKDVIQFAVLTQNGKSGAAAEGYSLNVTPNNIQISGEERGVFYGLQTLMQLLPAILENEAKLPAVEIKDGPRFGYRGMHLDVSRHFFPVEFVKKYIDLMSQYKFNQFHWHLTDDQGWRIEIKKYPKLTEIGSKRPESHLGSYSTTFKGDGIPVEGFYTQEQIKDVVAYAKARYINVIPEIELPGHSSAALAGYPELSCKADLKYKVQMTWGIFKEVYCPTEKTFQFLEDVIAETIPLFPDSPYIHVGGDEVLKDMWKESPEVKEIMARENLKDEHEVQSYFIRRMEKFINSKGKRVIGWDEILEGGLAPNATVMSWRGIKGGIEAAKAKHDVIMTPTDYCYFDYGQGDPGNEPLNIGGYLPLDKVYSYDPVPKELTADEAKYVLGVQANIWSEYLPTPASVEYSGFPRILALSEVAWTSPENKNYADFSKRLAINFAYLDKQNVNYRIPEPVGLKNSVVGGDGKATVELWPAAGTKIYYTTNGTTPDERSKVYDKPIVIELKQGEKAELNTVVANAKGRKSVVYAATLVRSEMLPAVEPSGKTTGVTYSLFVPSNAYGQDTVPQKGESKTITLQQFAKQIDPKQTFGVTFEGYLNIAADGIYDFQVDSTWDRILSIDGQKLIDEAGTKDHSVKSNVVPLKAGWHKISVHYDHHEGDMFFRVRYGLKGQGLRQLGGGELVH
ncbi:family 20 glycosylhydrolase [soil metagenome]